MPPIATIPPLLAMAVALLLARASAGTLPTEIIFASYRAADPGEIYELGGGTKARDVSQSPDEDRSLSVASDGSIAFESLHGRGTRIMVVPRGARRPRLLLSKPSAAFAQISPDGSKVAVWWNGDSGIVVQVVELASRTIRTFEARCAADELQWSPDATRLFCIEPLIRVHVFDARGRRLRSFRGIAARWVAPHGLAVTFRRSTTQLFDSQGMLVATRRGDPFSVSGDGRFVAVAAPGSLTILNGRTGRRVRTITGPRTWTPSGSFTPDSTELAYFRPDSSFRAVPVATAGRARALPSGGVWSNDGRTYAFLRTDSARWRVDVLVGNRYGAVARIVGSFPWDDHGGDLLLPAPHGFFLQTNIRTHPDLWSIRPGGSLRRVTRSGDARDPAWSPRGDRLAYASSTFSGGLCGYCSPQIVIARPEGRELTTLPSDLEDANPAWSPDGRRLAVEHGLDGEIDVVDVDGSNRRRLVAEGGFAPAWSPDGKTIAYTAYANGDGIHVISPSGAGDHLLISNATSPAWDPHGRRLAFVRNGAVFVRPVAKPGVARRLAAGDQPAFSPSGATLAFAGRDGIFLIDADGKNLRRLTRSTSDNAPAWRPLP